MSCISPYFTIFHLPPVMFLEVVIQSGSLREAQRLNFRQSVAVASSVVTFFSRKQNLARTVYPHIPLPSNQYQDVSRTFALWPKHPIWSGTCRISD